MRPVPSNDEDGSCLTTKNGTTAIARVVHCTGSWHARISILFSSLHHAGGSFGMNVGLTPVSSAVQHVELPSDPPSTFPDMCSGVMLTTRHKSIRSSLFFTCSVRSSKFFWPHFSSHPACTAGDSFLKLSQCPTSALHDGVRHTWQPSPPVQLHQTESGTLQSESTKGGFFADPRGVHECFLFPFSPDLRVSSGGPSPASRFVSWTWSPPLLAPNGAGRAACPRTSFGCRPQAAAAESQSYSLSCRPEWHHKDINEHLFLLRVRQDLQRVHRQLHCFFFLFFLSVLLDRPNEQCGHTRDKVKDLDSVSDNFLLEVKIAMVFFSSSCSALLDFLMFSMFPHGTGFSSDDRRLFWQSLRSSFLADSPRLFASMTCVL